MGQPRFYAEYAMSVMRRSCISDPVDGDIGQLFFKVFIHQVLVSVLRTVSAAGPAAEQNLCSGPFDVKIPAAGRAFFFQVHQLGILKID
jgi:hypothetical protein